MALVKLYADRCLVSKEIRLRPNSKSSDGFVKDKRRQFKLTQSLRQARFNRNARRETSFESRGGGCGFA